MVMPDVGEEAAAVLVKPVTVHVTGACTVTGGAAVETAAAVASTMTKLGLA